MLERPSGIKWLFMDLNSYFASVEQQENPMLRGKPVAVVPMDTPYTCAIAASYQAKAYGVKTGTIIRDAHHMCPDLHCVVARHDVYVDYHHRILEEVVKHTPINRIWSIDELSSRLPPSKRNDDDARLIAQRLKQGIWDHVGGAINCSVGFAPNSLLAKIACEMEKPDGLVILRQEDLPGRLLDLKLTDLPGIGANMDRRLRRAGVFSVEDFWTISPKHARKIWGSVQGERFWYQIHGYDLEIPETKPSMVGHSRVLDPDLRHPDTARLILRKLVMKAATRLRRKGFLAQKISVSARVKDGPKVGHTLSVSATQDSFELLRYVDDLWCDILYQFDRNRILIQKISVIFHDLENSERITDDLFKTQPHDKKNFGALTQALEHLQNKYKKEVVSLGIPPKTASGYVGTKIAFSRVPETEEFWS